MAVKVHHVDADVPKSHATEEHQNNEQVDKAAKIEVAQVDLDWEHKVQKSNGEWRLTVDYRGLNEVTPPMSAAVPDMLELQYELE
ncbi:hypothetical protein GRJ2_003433800 [Grus japonensis]|uniref:Uncharacterized protein n=1 Tax=Grus japonensis TaxID=30415 RepID=A0ABC9YIB9_GRUJA